MALCRTGSSILKATNSIFANPIFVLPSSINLQRRHAARKGYREKVKRQKSAEKIIKAATKSESRILKKYTKVTKTVDLKKPEPPSDDVIVTHQFNYMRYSLPEIIEFHREYHHPEIFNNPSAPVSLRIEIRMIGKKETQFLKPFSGIAPIPHPFALSVKREVLVFCKSEDVDFAFKCGAAMAGDIDLVKKVKEGTVQPILYDYVIAHSNILQELNPIRNILKLQYPKTKQGTLTTDLKFAIDKFLHGIEYSCMKVGDSQDFGLIDVDIGTLDMDTNHLLENFLAIAKDIEQHKPKQDAKFFSWIWCMSRPSPEQFSVDLSQYFDVGKTEETGEEGGEKKRKAAVEDDDDDDDNEDDQDAKDEIRQ